MTTPCTCSAVRPSSAVSSWLPQWATCPAASRTCSPSPTQTIGTSPCRSAACTLAATTASSSPCSVRRSECPTSTYWQASAASIAPLTSPVYAPESCAERSCAPYPISSLSPATSVCTL